MNTIPSDVFATALMQDYPVAKKKFIAQQLETYKTPNAYWISILRNIMHKGSNSATLNKRINTDEYRTISTYENCINVPEAELRRTLAKFVPGGQYESKENKINSLLAVIHKIGELGGIEKMFDSSQDSEMLLKNLESLPTVGCKIARNILMELYHPGFINGYIPIDHNWTKIGKLLGYKWKEPCKDEVSIIEWRNKFIPREVVATDWELDRLLYFSLNTADSHVNKLLESNQK